MIPLTLVMLMLIGYVDASIVAIAERLKINKILTLDRKHFGAVAPRGFDSFDILI